MENKKSEELSSKQQYEQKKKMREKIKEKKKAKPKKKNNSWLYWSLGMVVIITIIVLMSGNQESSSPQKLSGVNSFIVTDRNHTQDEVEYEQTPPVGGNHNPVWLSCNGDVYDDPVVNENAVHALEHGAVWITYKPTLTSEQIKVLEKKVRGYTFMSPYPEQESPIMLTAWGVQLSLESTEDPRIDQFLRKFKQGPQTPEPGATCNAIPGGMR